MGFFYAKKIRHLLPIILRLLNFIVQLTTLSLEKGFSKKINTKKSRTTECTGFIKVASTYSPTLKRAVPSAQSGLTSLFGMGRGGP